MIKKTDPQVAAIQTIIDQEKANGWPSGFPANGKVFMKDCAVAFPSEPTLAGYMVVSGNAKLEDKPAVVDMSMAPVIDPSQVYAGAICWVAFNSFVYDQNVNKGVSCGLNAVMITGELGELGRLDNRPSVESIFSDIVGGAAPAGAVSPAGGVVAPPTPPAPATPQYTMTAKANGATRDDLINNGTGWTDELLLQQDMMVLPGGVTTSFQ